MRLRHYPAGCIDPTTIADYRAGTMLPAALGFLVGLSARPLIARVNRLIQHRRLLARLNSPFSA